ncbi:hypothetical protein Riv7116_2160 [Rivularia sp. PCC 7116]|uniref:YdcF family protein n=1 Tax=Rivularia sp. PCC 7116 TaxID=373994 RepID=UPI00029EF86B|nr:YdcF family protein [Rivularia sp. PCC 7116]AFY54689.1 hypothetical protein Riv7116_2160 [Rivularia sp. PCC 7116]
MIVAILAGLGITVFASLLILHSLIRVRLNRTLKYYPKPQAILILDGNPTRIDYAAKLAHSVQLPIWISGNCSQLPVNKQRFKAAGIDSDKVNYDLRATDTVTHFTTLVKDFKNQDLHHVYIVTSDYHMPRSQTIATLVFGSHGLIVTSVRVPTAEGTSESPLKILRDYLRSLLWMLTGKTGASLNPSLNLDYIETQCSSK